MPADQVLEGVLGLLRVEAEAKGLSLEVNVAPGLPPVVATTDSSKSIWTNLISNAIKYSDAGGRITIALAQDGDQVLGSVQDTGIGIAPEDVPRLFEEFFRTEQARAMVQRGTGVGLAIVKRAVESSAAVYGPNPSWPRAAHSASRCRSCTADLAQGTGKGIAVGYGRTQETHQAGNCPGRMGTALRLTRWSSRAGTLSGAAITPPPFKRGSMRALR